MRSASNSTWGRIDGIAKIGIARDARGNDQRVALAKAGQADFTWIAVQLAGEGPMSFTLPDAPGYYEVR